MNPEHHYFAELFDGGKTELSTFSCNMEAVQYYLTKYGMNLLAVKRTGNIAKLVYSA